jgi:hypothetical protein
MEQCMLLCWLHAGARILAPVHLAGISAVLESTGRKAQSPVVLVV